MATVYSKLPAALRRGPTKEARRRRKGGAISCADLAGDLIGSLRGPGDLSTNKRYLGEAIVADAGRAKKPRR